MAPSPTTRQRGVEGTIARRLLVNAVVDPDEAAPRLPVGLRPHVTDQGTVVGCCLLEIDAVRPLGVPRAMGRRLRAAAHRISVEWDDEDGAVVTGVYVPVRHTDSRIASLVGGRWFPGVHQRSRIDVTASPSSLRWRSEPLQLRDLGIGVAVSLTGGAAVGEEGDPVGATCLRAEIGVSPDRRGRLEAVRMDPSHREARRVVVDDLVSGFVDGFHTSSVSTAYLMCDADVTWTRAQVPSARARALR
jgi:hypothetical protein